MPRLEYKGSLDHIPCCYICGERNKDLLNIDHRIPQALITVAKDMRLLTFPGYNPYTAHPMWETVYNPSNLYMICREHHLEVDEEKMDVFIGKWRFGPEASKQEKKQYLESVDRGEPALLMKWLSKRYPWSRYPYYHDMQRELTLISNRLFMDAVRNAEILVERSLNYPLALAPFGPELLEKYQQAARIVEQHQIDVRKMPSPPLIGFIDFGRYTTPEKKAA